MNSLRIYTFIFALLLSVSTFAQGKYASIIVNKPAITEVNLSQKINSDGDMLVLKTNQKIYKISVLFHSKKETLDIEFDHTEAKIPLYLFEKGNITIAVHPEQGNIYPISLTIHKTVPKPQDAVEDFEKSILVASLPEEEQYKRHLKPRPNKKNNTRVASVAPKKDNRASDRAAKEKAQRERIQREADRAKKEQALAEANRTKKERALAEAKKREAKEKEAKKAREIKEREDKANRELAQIKANKERLRKEALAESNRKALAAEKAERAEAKRLELEKSREANAIAKVDHDKEANVEDYDVKNVKYNLSELENRELEKQSRADYRKENLRPNGTKYDD